ncbi:MAG TPA: AAA family ATPase [Chloroflexia bacterium]|nr:AAA family ATPase [Chloroflexia bacterium]
MVQRGQIIYLNGISSAGKSSIIKELHPRLTQPYFSIGIDLFIEMVQERYWNCEPAGFVVVRDEAGAHIVGGPVAHQIDQAMLHTVVALAASGNNVLVDDVILSSQTLENRVRMLADFEVWFIGVKCPLEVAEQRERERGDRTIGMAKAQFKRAHPLDIYDLEVDTSRSDPLECARQILSALKDQPHPHAFRQLLNYNW